MFTAMMKLAILTNNFNKMSNALFDSYKKIEEQGEVLKKSLKEKDILLKELHHRVKNNLNLILSLIELQHQNITNDVIKDIFVKIQNRIYSIALIHKLLYKSHDISRIKFDKYIRDLVHNLKESFSVKKIHFKVRCEKQDLDIDKVKTLGIILNELITNSIKYAFPDGKEGITQAAARIPRFNADLNCPETPHA